jgi:PIN domain nuclease of toxin-antitoxin system
MAAVLDTHAAIWYVFTPSDLSQAAIQFVRQATADGKPLYISAISLVEIIYLVERKRVPLEALQRIESALKDNSSSLVVAPLDAAVAEAMPRIPRAIVSDMPDRIIAATALHLGLPLVTRDLRIHSAGIRTIW